MVLHEIINLNKRIRAIHVVYKFCDRNKIIDICHGGEVDLCGRDRMVVGFMTTYAIIAYHH